MGVSRRTMIGRWQGARLRLFDALNGQLPPSGLKGGSSRIMADDPRLGEILLRWGEAEIDGESVSIEDLCGGEPELLAAVRRRIDHLSRWTPCWKARPVPTRLRQSRLSEGPKGRAAEPDWKALGYEIVKVLGTGGMGIVYLARHVRLERLVALKTIPSWVKITPNALARFDIEARAVARLRHPNIVQIYRYRQPGRSTVSIARVCRGGQSEPCDPRAVARAPRSGADCRGSGSSRCACPRAGDSASRSQAVEHSCLR